jgi:hypothetical protein
MLSFLSAWWQDWLPKVDVDFPVQTEPQSKVSLDECVQYLERRLLSLTWIELRPLFLQMHRVAQSAQTLRDLASECKFNGIALTAPQQLKIHKIHDFVHENIHVLSVQCAVSVESPAVAVPEHLQVTSFLPSAHHLNLFAHKLTTKLKSVEDMLSSKKLDVCRFRFSGKLTLTHRIAQRQVFDVSLLRNECRLLHEQLHLLQQAVDEQDQLLQYFDLLKRHVHLRWQEVLCLAAVLPDVVVAKTRLAREWDLLMKHEHEYAEAKQQEVLVTCVGWGREQQLVETDLLSRLLQDSLQPSPAVLPVTEIARSLSEDTIRSNLSKDQLEMILEVVEVTSRDDLVAVLRKR